MFVVRARIGQYIRCKRAPCTHEGILDKKAATNTVYIDVRSEWLRDVLRTVLKGVYGISAKEDKPSASSPTLTMGNQPLTWAQVEQNLLYHHLPELKSHQSSTDPLDLLVALRWLRVQLCCSKRSIVGSTPVATGTAVL